MNGSSSSTNTNKSTNKSSFIGPVLPKQNNNNNNNNFIGPVLPKDKTLWQPELQPKQNSNSEQPSKKLMQAPWKTDDNSNTNAQSKNNNNSSQQQKNNNSSSGKQQNKSQPQVTPQPQPKKQELTKLSEEKIQSEKPVEEAKKEQPSVAKATNAVEKTATPEATSAVSKAVATTASATPVATSTSTGDVNMRVSIEGIAQHKAKIDSSANSLDTLYRAIMAQIAAISDSWIGPDATAYVEKIKELDPKIDAAISALRKISKTYEQALNEIQDNQNKIKSELI